MSSSSSKLKQGRESAADFDIGTAASKGVSPARSKSKTKLAHVSGDLDFQPAPSSRSALTSSPSKAAQSTPKRTAGDSSDSDVPRSAKRRRSGGPPVIPVTPSPKGKGVARKRSCERQSRVPSPAKPQSFAEMYTFKSKSETHGLVDLTKSPTSSPARNGMYNSIGKSNLNPHQGPRKLVIKNIKTVPREDKYAFFERKWKEQEAALDRLFTAQDTKLLLEELYKGAEHICRQGMAKELFDKLKTKCSTHLSQGLRARLRRTAESSPVVDAVKAFVDTWLLWQKQQQTVRHIFFYLNQTYLIRSPDELDLDALGLHLFRQLVFADEVIRKQVLSGTVELISRDRKNASNATEIALSKEAISTFHDLGVYTNDFEPALLTASEEHFTAWRSLEAESQELPHYVRSCTELLKREMTRCDTIGLDRNTRAQLSDMIDDIFVEANVSRLTEDDSIQDMLEDNMTDELEQTFSLLKRREHEQKLVPSFSKFIEMEGSLIVFDEERESEMVIRLLDFKRKLDFINSHCFHDHESLGNALHKAFEVFMNKTKKTESNWDTDNAKPGEMIAKHIDLLLKGGAKAVPVLKKADTDKKDEEQDYDNEEGEQEVEKHLDDALDLFRFVHGKAVFEAFYKKDLARRLLMGRTQSFDSERNMLTRLRNECGAGFTHNLESMFKDMELAREEMKSYSQLLSDRGMQLSPDIGVTVLSVSAWPTYSDVPVNLPTSILKAQADFEKHYKDKHVGRKLTYKHQLAHCQLKSRFARGVKEIVVSGFQAVVLLLFNHVAADQHLSYTDIKSSTALPDAELIRTLQSLACAKYRVLTKHPKGRDVNESDTFTFNAAFTDPKVRIKINQIQLKETKEENKETHQRVAADRHYETQAAIVRIMKGAKKIGHNELIVEVIKATRSRGVLDQADIRKNIEKLIEKEYMERDEDMKNGYRYLA